MPWFSNTMAAQQQSGNQGGPYGSSSNQYIINSNQENYLQSLAGFHQSPSTHPSFQQPYWSPLPTAMMFPAPPPQSMLAQQQQQQQAMSNEQQSPQSKANNNRPMTPTNSADLLSTSQPNQQGPHYINMPRTAQTPGNSDWFNLPRPFSSLVWKVNFPFFAAASPPFLDPNLMMQTSRQPGGSPGIRMYQQQVPIPSEWSRKTRSPRLWSLFSSVNASNQGGIYGSPVTNSLSSSFNGMFLTLRRREASTG